MNTKEQLNIRKNLFGDELKAAKELYSEYWEQWKRGKTKELEDGMDVCQDFFSWDGYNEFWENDD